MSTVDDLHRRFATARAEEPGGELAFRREVALVVLSLPEVPEHLGLGDICGEYLEWRYPHPEDLDRARNAIWGHLDTKHGNSTTIEDREDRTLRGALALVDDAHSDADVGDTVGWAAEMLAVANWPRPMRYF